ncbi:hypothetical protein B0H14DRAFT_2616857 [Mycena olivaceomarginata]|nr:hypothetical protein B0H14DRAFT_2616857 [Mycena olivaceomarginata]
MVPPNLAPPYEYDIKKWAWFRVSPLVKVGWAPQGDGTFECQILAWENHTAMVDDLDDIKGYVTSNLSGEKTVPGPMQDIIMSSPQRVWLIQVVHTTANPLIGITSAVMFGCEHPQAKIDVHNALIDTPIIEEANENTPAFSRSFKEMILIASLDKPLPRAGKGTVQSKAAINQCPKLFQGVPSLPRSPGDRETVCDISQAAPQQLPKCVKAPQGLKPSHSVLSW